MACDICGKTGVSLQPLRLSYQTAEIKDVCGECVSVIDKRLDCLQTMTGKIQAVLLQRFMGNMRRQPPDLRKHLEWALRHVHYSQHTSKDYRAALAALEQSK